MAAVGLLVLSQIGGLLVTEVIKEVKVEERGAVSEAGLGKPAPNFELPDLASQKIKLSDYLGAPLVLTFWATWNNSAADQIKILDDLQKSDFGGLQEVGILKIIAISSQEDKSAVSSFIKRGGYKVTVLLDETGEVTDRYQARSLPATYFVDKDGALRDVFIGILSEKQLVEKAEKIIQ